MELDCEEFHRWFDQAVYTFNLIDSDIENSGYSWACFKAQQSAELAIKGILLAMGKNASGHGILKLYKDVSKIFKTDQNIENSVPYLDKLYILPGHPDAFTEGSLWEHFIINDAIASREAAKNIIEFTEKVMASCL